MGRDLKNKTMATKYAFSKISRGSVGNVKKGFAIISVCKLIFDL
jgi:hypothetical protein